MHGSATRSTFWQAQAAQRSRDDPPRLTDPRSRPIVSAAGIEVRKPRLSNGTIHRVHRHHEHCFLPYGRARAKLRCPSRPAPPGGVRRRRSTANQDTGLYTVLDNLPREFCLCHSGTVARPPSRTGGIELSLEWALGDRSRIVWRAARADTNPWTHNSGGNPQEVLDYLAVQLESQPTIEAFERCFLEYMLRELKGIGTIAQRRMTIYAIAQEWATDEGRAATRLRRWINEQRQRFPDWEIPDLGPDDDN